MFLYQIKNPANGYTNGGYTPATLSVPTAGTTTILPQTAQNTAFAVDQQQANFQPIRTIQPVRSRLIVYTTETVGFYPETELILSRPGHDQLPLGVKP